MYCKPHNVILFSFLTLCVSVIYWFALLYYSFLKYVLFTILTYFIWYYLTRCCMISHLLLIQYITCFYVCKITFSYVICFWSYIELHILCCDINVYCIIFLSCDCKCNCMCIVQFYAVSYRKLYIVLFCFMFKNMLFWHCIIVSKENSWRKLRVTDFHILTSPKIIVSSWHVP